MQVKNKKLNNAVVCYDAMMEYGGAENVTELLSSILANALICTDFDLRKIGKDRSESRPLHTIGKPIRSRTMKYLLGMSHFKNRTKFLENYDLAVFSGTTAPLAVHNHPTGRNILYCHTIPRFAYDLREYTLASLPAIQRPLANLLISYIKRQYELAIGKMDLIISNSKTVKNRLHDYLGLDSIIIHPPCSTEDFHWLTCGDYYLSTSRLEPYKRVELIVEAFTLMPDKKLVVTSGGSELDKLRKIAAPYPNITFTGWLDQPKLVQLMGNCLASIYIPIQEDFGISPVESMAAGKPVIGTKEGGLLETVLDDQTGILLPAKPVTTDLIDAVKTMTPSKAMEMRSACEAQSKLFGQKVFEEKIKTALGLV